MGSLEYQNIKKFENNHWWYVTTHRAVERELCRLTPNSKVLDAGCESGGLLDLLRERFQVNGFDAPIYAVRAVCERKDLSNKITQGLIETIPAKNGQFHVVTSIDVIYHLKVKSERRALMEIHRILKPGGYLELQVPAFEFLRGGPDRVVHTRKRHTKSEIGGLLQEMGYKIVMIRYWYP